jgi:hypothetical protein
VSAVIYSVDSVSDVAQQVIVGQSHTLFWIGIIWDPTATESLHKKHDCLRFGHRLIIHQLLLHLLSQNKSDIQGQKPADIDI